MMELRGIEFGRVWAASGVQGFFGEGYWFHPLLQRLGLTFEHITFVAKSATLMPRRGNLPLRHDFTPQEKFPKCIIVKPLAGVVLNAVGLSNPGAEALFDDGRWQRRTQPFFISFAPAAKTFGERMRELLNFVGLFGWHLSHFKAPVGLQLNYSCPNAGSRRDVEELITEIHEGLEIASALRIPLVPKLAVTFPVEAALRIAEHVSCDALCVSNAIPWRELPESINWKELFGTGVSPLEEFGGGGLSGRPLLHIVTDWVRRARHAGLTKPLNGCGGILSRRDAEQMFEAGADSISLGSVVLLRPWKVRRIVF